MSFVCEVMLTSSWIWCSNIPSSSVQALAQDAENDVWLNVISLSFPVSRACQYELTASTLAR